VSFIIKPLASLPDVRLALTISASKQLSCFRKSKFSLLAGVASRTQLCKESVEPSSLLSKDRSILLQKNIVSLLKGFVPKPPVYSTTLIEQFPVANSVTSCRDIE
jgi:hypothetical protein